MKTAIVRDFVRAAGSRLAHVTARENVPFIRKHGLMSAHDLACEIGISADVLALRDHRLELEGADRRAILNHQRPILHGLRAAAAVLDGHDAGSWAEALDRRVFLWPERRGGRFAASIDRDRPVSVLWIDTAALAEAMFEAIDLAPINTGNFTQGGARARRGDWVYVPLARGLVAFRSNRNLHTGKRTPDEIREISLRQRLPPGQLDAVLLKVEY